VEGDDDDEVDEYGDEYEYEDADASILHRIEVEGGV